MTIVVKSVYGNRQEPSTGNSECEAIFIMSADPQPDTDNRPSVESVCSLTGISKDTRQAEETLTRVSALRA